MLKWSSLEPLRIERGVQQLLRTQFPGLVSLDGAGGDGGRDSQLVTRDGFRAFEVKSFSSRLTTGQRRQIEKSLGKAVANLPDLQRWTLILPLNPTPGELAWFKGKLQDIAGPHVVLDWCGIDWLDGHAANNRAFRNYVEGPQSELLELASRYNMEQATLTSGAADLFSRNAGLRELVDGISMNWTADWAVAGGTQAMTLRAKHPDAHLVDPITLTPTFRFDQEDAESVATREQLVDVLDFGGEIEVPDRFIAGVDVEASDEAKLLFSGLEGPGRLVIKGEPELIDPPVRAKLEICTNGAERLQIAVWFRSREAGSKGARLHGSDAAGAILVELKLPYPKPDEDGAVRFGAGFNISFPSPWKFAIDDVLPALRLQAALQKGGQLMIQIPGLAMAKTQARPNGESTIDFATLVRLGEVVQRLAKRFDLALRLPGGATLAELRLAEAALATFEQDNVVAPYNEFTGDVRRGRADALIGSLPEGPFGASCCHSDFVLTLGELEIPFGPLAIWMPKAVLTNRAEVLAQDGQGGTAVFRTAGEPMYFRSREFATDLAAQDAAD